MQQFLPITAWLPRYPHSQLRSDLMAGLAIWALTVPQALAYAGIAGVPPVHGLYSVPLAMIAYAVLGTSHTLSVGPDSATALLSATAVSALAAGTTESITLTAGLAMLVGVFFLLFGLLRLGWVANFLATPVLKGFTHGLAVIIILGQIPKLLGVEGGKGYFFRQLWAIVTRLPQSHLLTVIVGVLSLLLLFGLPRFAAKAPVSLITVIMAILGVSLFDLEAKGVAVVGSIQTGLPPLALPTIPLTQLQLLIPGALTIALVGYAESVAVAKTSAEVTGEDIRPNQELVALGVANLGAGFSSGFVGMGSLSRGSVILAAGGRSQIVSLVNAVLVILTLLVLMPLFRNLPQATLGALVIAAMVQSLKPEYVQALRRIRIEEFRLFLIAFLGELFLGVFPGIALGVILSLIQVIRRGSYPHTAVLGQKPGKESYLDRTQHPEVETIPGLLIYRFDAQLAFANAPHFVTQLRQYIAETDPPVQQVLISAETINDIDTTGIDQLLKLHQELTRQGITLTFAHVHDRVWVMLNRSGAIDGLGTDHFFESIADGVTAFIKSQKDS
ncbi:MAG: SulP family inorganic anion transporter [Elainellaceae cyanobacterium]